MSSVFQLLICIFCAPPVTPCEHLSEWVTVLEDAYKWKNFFFFVIMKIIIIKINPMIKLEHNDG